MTQPSPTWSLALAELLFYLVLLMPTTYLLWRHRHTALVGWIMLFAYSALQLIGNALTVSAGKHGTPSTAAVIITQVGLSPLILGLGGQLEGWTKVTGFVDSTRRKRTSIVVMILFHLAVMASIAIYAIGASSLNDSPPKESAKDEYRGGIILLFLCWLAIVGAFALLAFRISRRACPELFWALAISLLLLGVRLVYQTVATFSSAQELNPVEGNVVLKGVFEFATGALILLTMVVAGGLTLGIEAPKKDGFRQGSLPQSVPLSGVPTHEWHQQYEPAQQGSAQYREGMMV